MAQVIQTTFKFRRNTSEYWEQKNPLLAEGEPCFELDTGKLKIDNGTTTYNDLPYINSTITAISTDLLTQGTEEIIFNCGSVD